MAGNKNNVNFQKSFTTETQLIEINCSESVETPFLLQFGTTVSNFQVDYGYTILDLLAELYIVV